MGENSVFYRVNTDIVKKGILGELSGNACKTLFGLACFMDKEGYCFPTQRQLAELLKIDKNTVKNRIEEILSIEIDGKPLLTREYKSGSVGSRCVYKINPISQISIFEGKPEEMNAEILTIKKNPIVEEKKFNSNDVIRYFREKYFEKYGEHYTVNFGKDGSLIKGKLLKTYSEEQIKEIIDIAMAKYETEWKTSKFPRPTIAALTTFLPNVCLALKSEQEKKDKAIQASIQDGVRYKEQLKKLASSENLFE